MFTQSSTICVFIFWVCKPINGFQSPLFYCKKNTLPWTLLYYRILRTHQSVHNIVFTLIATTIKCCFFQRVWCVSFIQAEKQTNNSLWYYNFEEKEKKINGNMWTPDIDDQRHQSSNKTFRWFNTFCLETKLSSKRCTFTSISFRQNFQQLEKSWMKLVNQASVEIQLLCLML